MAGHVEVRASESGRVISGPAGAVEERWREGVDEVVCGDAEWRDFLEGTVGGARPGVDAALRHAELTVLADCVDDVVWYCTFRLGWRVVWEAWFHFCLFVVGRFRHALALSYPAK